MSEPGTSAAPPPLPLESVACALCGRDDAPAVLHGRDARRGLPGRFQVVRCPGCGLAWVNPRPTREGIARYYPPDYAPHRAGPPGRLEALYYRWFRAPPVAPGSRVLDVGCGGGRYLLFLRERGYRVVGVEPNAELARELRERFGLEVHAGELVEAGLAAGSFDAVTFWWVLEHTHDPLAALREAHRLLRPGGWLVVALQNFASLARRIFGADWHHVDLPAHLYQFEPRTLARALERSGFRVERLRQDLVAKDFAPSLGHRLGLSLDRALPNLLALPFDLAACALGRSGLMTAWARK
jgi:SAM-dependent methyltransferase